MNERETTLTDRRLEDRRGRGKPISMFEQMYLLVYGERRQAERRES